MSLVLGIPEWNLSGIICGDAGAVVVKNRPANPTLWFWRTVKCLQRVTVKASPWREYKEDPQDKVNDYIWSFWPASFREFSLLNFTPSQLGTLPPPNCILCWEGWILVSEMEFFLGPSCPCEGREGRGGEWASSPGPLAGGAFFCPVLFGYHPTPMLGAAGVPPQALCSSWGREWRPPGMWMPWPEWPAPLKPGLCSWGSS